MMIPNTVNVDGIDYTIVMDSAPILDNAVCYGIHSGKSSEIILNSSEDISYQMRCITLWHEILHAIILNRGIKVENEEEVVEQISRGVYQVIQSNLHGFFGLEHDVVSIPVQEGGAA